MTIWLVENGWTSLLVIINNVEVQNRHVRVVIVWVNEHNLNTLTLIHYNGRSLFFPFIH